jgi:hypothetical protein
VRATDEASRLWFLLAPLSRSKLRMGAWVAWRFGYFCHSESGALWTPDTLPQPRHWNQTKRCSPSQPDTTSPSFQWRRWASQCLTDILSAALSSKELVESALAGLVPVFALAALGQTIGVQVSQRRAVAQNGFFRQEAEQAQLSHH